MKVAVVRFPGSNCDQDGFFALRDDLGLRPEYVWYEESSLRGFDAAFLPGGFSYGDYLRCGAMAARAPVMDEVRRLAREGRPVIGVCNGFQALCEAGLLPGALMANAGRKFLCRDVWIAAARRDSIWTRGLERPLRVPIAHGEGRYVADAATLDRLEADGRVAFRYTDAAGSVAAEGVSESNPNGSERSIAGVLSAEGNVLGLMPHPERASRAEVGGTDGRLILRAFALVGA